MNEMKVMDPVQAEVEGSAGSWWYVCGECHGQISRPDLYCRHCGRRIVWDEIQKPAAE